MKLNYNKQSKVGWSNHCALPSVATSLPVIFFLLSRGSPHFHALLLRVPGWRRTSLEYHDNRRYSYAFVPHGDWINCCVFDIHSLSGPGRRRRDERIKEKLLNASSSFCVSSLSRTFARHRVYSQEYYSSVRYLSPVESRYSKGPQECFPFDAFIIVQAIASGKDIWNNGWILEGAASTL